MRAGEKRLETYSTAPYAPTDYLMRGDPAAKFLNFAGGGEWGKWGKWGRGGEREVRLD